MLGTYLYYKNMFRAVFAYLAIGYTWRLSLSVTVVVPILQP